MCSCKSEMFHVEHKCFANLENGDQNWNIMKANGDMTPENSRWLNFTICRSIVTEGINNYSSKTIILPLKFLLHSHQFCLQTRIDFIFNIFIAELYLEMEFNAENFYITCLMHPSTYLNKILLCSRQGQMQLWNIKTKYVCFVRCCEW